jgi:hypothetical protein
MELHYLPMSEVLLETTQKRRGFTSIAYVPHDTSANRGGCPPPRRGQGTDLLWWLDRHHRQVEPLRCRLLRSRSSRPGTPCGQALSLLELKPYSPSRYQISKPTPFASRWASPLGVNCRSQMDVKDWASNLVPHITLRPNMPSMQLFGT